MKWGRNRFLSRVKGRGLVGRGSEEDEGVALQVLNVRGMKIVQQKVLSQGFVSSGGAPSSCTATEEEMGGEGEPRDCAEAGKGQKTAGELLYK